MTEQYGIKDADGFESRKMLEAGPLENVAALTFAINQVHKTYTSLEEPVPLPLPDSLATLPPCSVLVTERYKRSTDDRIGRIRFFRPDGTSLFDQTWTISKPPPR